MDSEPLCVVVLTRDEPGNLPDCLAALVPQLGPEDEVVLIDATPHGVGEAAREPAELLGRRMRIERVRSTVSAGAARNRALEVARADVIVMLDADAVPERGWLAGLRRALGNADVVYGRQRHAPTRLNASTVSRGLRFHRYEVAEPVLADEFASNANAAYRRLVFGTVRFDERAPGSEDVALAREARLAGFRIAYAADALVSHRQPTTFRREWRKSATEGAAHAHLRNLLGSPTWHVAWAVSVVGLLLIAMVAGEPLVLLGTLLVFLAPTLRRLRSSMTRSYRAAPLLGGILASPLFDLAFVASYLTRRVRT